MKSQAKRDEQTLVIMRTLLALVIPCFVIAVAAETIGFTFALLVAVLALGSAAYYRSRR